jgi:hypothetical protein
MSVDPNTSEWNLLKHQFDALVHNESADAASIEKIFDAEFRHQFTELIDQTAQRNRTSAYNWPRRSPMGYKGRNVRYWHETDIEIAAWNVRYWD